jgi:cytochrome c oxidase cbb3-type subunit 3
MWKVLVASAIAAVAFQAPVPQAPPQPPAPPAGGNPQGTFPAQQRALADPAVIERGQGIYASVCSACHGADLRGGQLGGPNLLRSQVVLSDQHGEGILPIVRGARAERGMPALPLPDQDVTAVAEYIHSVAARSEHQGAPPPSAAPPPDPIVGDAAAGEQLFQARCTSCHSATGDLAGIATRIPEGKALQNAWVSGRGAGGRRGGGSAAAGSGAGAPDRRTVTAVVTLASGERIEGPLVRLDNFFVTVRQPDGSQRTIRRSGNTPRIELTDPLAAHKAMLATITDKEMHDVTAYLAGLK